MRNLLNTTGMAGIITARTGPAIVHMDVYSANTLTGLIGQLYAALDVVSRELVGFIPSVNRNTGAERAAVGQMVSWPVVPALAARDIVPAMQVPTPPDIALGNSGIAITKSRAVPFGWTGEEERALNNGVGALTVQGDLFAQGLRTLVNEIEADGALEAALNGSRAVGTAGTTPFATNLGDSAQLRKILDDNGAPATDRSMIINTTAGAALRTLQNLTRVNEAGTAMTLRDGELLNIHGFSIKESAAAVQFTAGTGAGATTNAAGYAAGARTITLASAGTGTIKQGDVIQFAGDTNKYIVASGDANVADGGTITIAQPGLRVAIPAAATAITVNGSHAVNVGFSRNALALASRQPALPNQGDMALDRMTLTDPRSGLVFEVSIYPGYRMIEAEVAMAWGWKATKPEHIGVLMG